MDDNNNFISVGELNRKAKHLLESELGTVQVVGEVSNLARPSSGHMYFTLKDEDGAVRCAMFRNQNMRLNFAPENGDLCAVEAQVSLYAPRGDYQLIVSRMEPYGEGNLAKQFELLKAKLEKEGLFDHALKREIPKYPIHVAVVTSSSTAAFQDVMTTVERRARNTQLTIVEATVQGDTAPRSLINALEQIETFNANNPSNAFDLILMCRGGGSIEDLWCFNHEDLARKIHRLDIPLISAVGHEIDFTICDFVADLRAPTPTAGAEIVTEYYYQSLELLNDFQEKIKKSFQTCINNEQQRIALLKAQLKSPLSIIKERAQAIDSMELKIFQNIKNLLKDKHQAISINQISLNQLTPSKKIREMRLRFMQLTKEFKGRIARRLEGQLNQLAGIEKRLRAVSPYSILDRGYSIVTNSKQEIIKNVGQAKSSEKLSVKLSDGELSVKVSK